MRGSWVWGRPPSPAGPWVGTGQHAGRAAPDVLEEPVVVVEGRDDPRAELRADLFVYPARTLVDDEEPDVVLPHLAGDRPEDRVSGDVGGQELVRFLDRDHELRRMVAT